MWQIVIKSFYVLTFARARIYIIYIKTLSTDFTWKDTYHESKETFQQLGRKAAS